MANSGDGDKFGSLIIPNCHRTASQEEKLQSCPFARESKAFPDKIQASEQDTALLESSDEYHTPPEHQSCSQNSSNDGQVPPTKISALDRDIESSRVGDEDPMPVDDDLGFPEKSPRVLEDNNTHPINKNDTDQMDVDGTHQVFVEMPHRKQETSNREKRKLPFTMKTRNQNSKCYKHEAFTSSLNSVLKLVGEGRSRGGGDEDADVDINLLETAKTRGLTFPCPRWWPAEGFKD
ncbi:hypothetical protein L1987_07807 [Smallanthus sonchifolius]|uniref:Uncharacterized protein n=1 Tax=Smallanthus sonchifolius TaxID=185202 RepID=A0ACB9JKR2_9ASTR|nr:hypothetical protein L1987_07807 [Smallanthus sonchifolius]